MAVDAAQTISYRPGTPGERTLTEMLAFIQGKSVAAYVRDLVAGVNEGTVQELGGLESVMDEYERGQREKMTRDAAIARDSLGDRLAHSGRRNKD